MVYDWKYNMPVKAQVAGEYLDDLEKQHGALTPKLVLDNSRQENDVLHKCFEWDDLKAAEKHRENQARLILRNLVVVVENANPESNTVRAFVNIKENGSSDYYTICNVCQDETMEAQMFKTALKELKSFQKKYAGLTKFSAVFKEIDNLTFDDLLDAEEAI